MARGRKITLHLADGSPNGIIKARMGNWVGVVTYAPRTKLDDIARDSLVKRPGVYILSGYDPEQTRDRAVYIGEGENVFKRLKEQNSKDDKEFFDHFAVITSTDEHLTKGHIRYLESRLIALARETKRASVVNITTPELPPLPEEDADEMEVFLEHLQMILPVLGLNFALPLPKKRDIARVLENKLNGIPYFQISAREQETGHIAQATAMLTDSEFVVLEGSYALKRNIIQTKGYKELKAALVTDGILVEEGDFYRFTRDESFTSPSAAACIVMGRNANGRTNWKLDNGMTYGEWDDQRIAESEKQAES